MTAAAAAGTVASEASTAADGPVMSMMNKRLRALRKKYNRILQMEENVAQGKPLNKEQEEVLRSKPAVLVLIEEYDRLRQPLSSAVEEEHSVYLSQVSSVSSTPSADAAPPTSSESEQSGDPDAYVEDLLKLLYFGSLFDFKQPNEYDTMMWTRSHERGCCITYDTVTDETTSLLEEKDLDMISALGNLVLSRPPNTNVSHRNALLGCLQHAKLWLQNSDHPIQSGSSYTYADLRELLNRILASDYATATPEFTARPEFKPPVDLSADVGKYAASQVQTTDFINIAPAVQTEVVDQYQHKGDDSENSQMKETGSNQSSQTEEVPKLNHNDALSPEDVTLAQQQFDKLQVDEEQQNQRDVELTEQQYVSRRGYQNQRGVSRGGGGGMRRGYSNGRGGRGGRGGGYQNGRSQYYDSGYYPRNYYNTRGRGGRSSGPAMYSNHGAAGHGGHAHDMELGAS